MSQRTVGQLIKRNVVYLPSSTNVSEASKVMATKHIGAVLVMDDGQLEGIFTERDAVIRVLAERRDPEATQLSEVMTRDPITIAPHSAATDALRLMSEVGFRHIPIAEGGEVYGVISIRDFVGVEL